MNSPLTLFYLLAFQNMLYEVTVTGFAYLI